MLLQIQASDKMSFRHYHLVLPGDDPVDPGGIRAALVAQVGAGAGAVPLGDLVLQLRNRDLELGSGSESVPEEAKVRLGLTGRRRSDGHRRCDGLRVLLAAEEFGAVAAAALSTLQPRDVGHGLLQLTFSQRIVFPKLKNCVSKVKLSFIASYVREGRESPTFNKSLKETTTVTL